MNKKSNRVLITGASSGIGRELAHVFARHGHSLILTSMIETQLAGLTRELAKKYGAEVLFVAQDILRPQAPQQLYAATQLKRLRIEVLVNNTGVGYKGEFVRQTLGSQLEMIRLNIDSLVAMTRLFLPDMISRREGRILNVASTASFIPAPHMAVYHATKAFVVSFSEAVATEVKESGVTVTALCPGSPDAAHFQKGDTDESDVLQKENLMSPQEVAEEGYRALMDGERVHITGGLRREPGGIAVQRAVEN